MSTIRGEHHFQYNVNLFSGTRRLRVAQNQITSKHLIGRWPGYSVRTWYLEIGYSVQTFEDYVKVLERGKNTNFTHMVWPNLQFIGCSAA